MVLLVQLCSHSTVGAGIMLSADRLAGRRASQHMTLSTGGTYAASPLLSRVNPSHHAVC